MHQGQNWFSIAEMKHEDTDSLMFEDLANVMLGLLTIPHSSAQCERVFSCVRKNRTPQRSSMSDQTMESLLVLKSRPVGILESVKALNDKDLKLLKGAYYQSLKKNDQTTS